MTEHERESMTRHDDEILYPKLKSIGFFIERIGFPVFAFCLMFWMAYSSIGKMTEAIDRNAKAMAELSAFTSAFRQSVQAEHLKMMEAISSHFYRTPGTQ